MPQYPEPFQRIINEQVNLYERKRAIKEQLRIPPTDQIPLKDHLPRLKIPNVISVFVDMKSSTQLSAQKDEHTIARAYQLFTGTAVALFYEFKAPYIDVRGDGVLALFDYDQVHRALAAAITFKTFAQNVFVSEMKKITNIELSAHIGIDQGTVLVCKIGFKRRPGRSDRLNEVWAGKPVNMSSKLAAMADAGELLVSERYYKRISHEQMREIYGHQDDKREDLWMLVDAEIKKDPKFDFATAYRLDLCWSKKHGKEYCDAIMALDQKTTAKSH